MQRHKDTPRPPFGRPARAQSASPAPTTTSSRSTIAEVARIAIANAAAKSRRRSLENSKSFEDNRNAKVDRFGVTRRPKSAAAGEIETEEKGRISSITTARTMVAGTDLKKKKIQDDHSNEISGDNVMNRNSLTNSPFKNSNSSQMVRSLTTSPASPMSPISRPVAIGINNNNNDKSNGESGKKNSVSPSHQTPPRGGFQSISSDSMHLPTNLPVLGANSGSKIPVLKRTGVNSSSSSPVLLRSVGMTPPPLSNRGSTTPLPASRIPSPRVLTPTIPATISSFSAAAAVEPGRALLFEEKKEEKDQAEIYSSPLKRLISKQEQSSFSPPFGLASETKASPEIRNQGTTFGQEFSSPLNQSRNSDRQQEQIRNDNNNDDFAAGVENNTPVNNNNTSYRSQFSSPQNNNNKGDYSVEDGGNRIRELEDLCSRQADHIELLMQRVEELSNHLVAMGQENTRLEELQRQQQQEKKSAEEEAASRENQETSGKAVDEEEKQEQSLLSETQVTDALAELSELSKSRRQLEVQMEEHSSALKKMQKDMRWVMVEALALRESSSLFSFPSLPIGETITAQKKVATTATAAAGAGSDSSSRLVVKKNIISFVNCKIENAGRLWISQSEAMAVAVSQYLVALRSNLKQWEGVEIETDISTISFAFPSVVHAVEWCMRVQLVLLEQNWSEEIIRACGGENNKRLWRGLRSKMGVHFGSSSSISLQPHHGGTKYSISGNALAKARQLASTAAGGQILLSGECGEMISKRLAQIKNQPKMAPILLERSRGEPKIVQVYQLLPESLRERSFSFKQEVKESEDDGGLDVAKRMASFKSQVDNVGQNLEKCREELTSSTTRSRNVKEKLQETLADFSSLTTETLLFTLRRVDEVEIDEAGIAAKLSAIQEEQERIQGYIDTLQQELADANREGTNVEEEVVVVVVSADEKVSSPEATNNNDSAKKKMKAPKSNEDAEIIQLLKGYQEKMRVVAQVHSKLTGKSLNE